MKNNTILSLLSAVFLLTAIFAAGCEESNKFSDKRAMLVGNENLQLKDQIKQKDKEIKALNKQIKGLKGDIVKCQENTKISVQRVTKGVADMMGTFAETTRKAATLEAENAQLKEQLKN